MRIDIRTWIILALMAVVVLMILFRPGSPPTDEQAQREKAYKIQAAILEEERRTIAFQMDSIFKSAKAERQKDSTKLRAKESEIQRLKVKAAKKVVAIPVQAHQDYPQIQEALNAKDSVITVLDSTVHDLRFMAYRAAKEFDDLSVKAVDDQRIAAKMLQDCESNREALKGDLEKAQAKHKALGWKALGVGSAIVAIWQAAKNAAD